MLLLASCTRTRPSVSTCDRPALIGVAFFSGVNVCAAGVGRSSRLAVDSPSEPGGEAMQPVAAMTAMNSECLNESKATFMTPPDSVNDGKAQLVLLLQAITSDVANVEPGRHAIVFCA